MLAGITLIRVNQDRTVHLLHLLFSVPFGMYSTSRQIFACLGKLPEKGLPLVFKILTEAFAVWRSIPTIPRADHVSRL